MKLAVIMSGFPRRSETFALNELVALEAAGLLEVVFATKAGDGSTHPGLERVAHRVRTLAPGTPAEQGCEVAMELAGVPISGLHAYFAHVPAEVASHAAGLLGCAWGFSTHALDARKVRSAELAERARRAACIVACNHDVAAELSALAARVTLIPHGVDIERFQPDGPATVNGRLSVLAVGRLVEKKGFSVLIDAVALADEPLSVRIVGDGPLRGHLAAQIASAGVGDRVSLTGPMTHTDLPGAYQAAQVVAVPSIVNAEGDRDGLPNVVLEAMAMGRPVIASDVGAVSAAVHNDATGLLVPAGDAGALAAALDRLASDVTLRGRLGAAARRRVEQDYELGGCTARLIQHLESVYAN